MWSEDVIRTLAAAGVDAEVPWLSRAYLAVEDAPPPVSACGSDAWQDGAWPAVCTVEELFRLITSSHTRTVPTTINLTSASLSRARRVSLLGVGD